MGCFLFVMLAWSFFGGLADVWSVTLVVDFSISDADEVARKNLKDEMLKVKEFPEPNQIHHVITVSGRFQLSIEDDI